MSNRRPAKPDKIIYYDENDEKIISDIRGHPYVYGGYVHFETDDGRGRRVKVDDTVVWSEDGKSHIPRSR